MTERLCSQRFLKMATYQRKNILQNFFWSKQYTIYSMYGNNNASCFINIIQCQNLACIEQLKTNLTIKYNFILPCELATKCATSNKHCIILFLHLWISKFLIHQFKILKQLNNFEVKYFLGGKLSWTLIFKYFIEMSQN